jgi:hypothetical protein
MKLTQPFELDRFDDTVVKQTDLTVSNEAALLPPEVRVHAGCGVIDCDRR